MESGTHTFRRDGSDTQGRKAASGVYLYQLKEISGIQIRRMILLEQIKSNTQNKAICFVCLPERFSVGQNNRTNVYLLK